MKSSDLEVGAFYRARRVGGIIVLAKSGWRRHPRYAEFEEDKGARGVAVAVYRVDWNGIVKWHPEVVQAHTIEKAP